MKIILVGAGKIGTSVAAILAEEGHDITVIDRDGDIVQALSNELDAIFVEGSATDAEVLREAGAAQADLLMAATEQDEVNMVCGISARRLGTRHVIARVRDPQYLRQSDFLREALGLSVIVNPDYECAKEISRILRFPGAARVDAFSRGSAEIVEHRVETGGKLDGLTLKRLGQEIGAKVLVSVVERDGQAIIPNGDFTLRGGDRMSVTGSTNELRRFFTKAGAFKRPVRSVMLVGGSRIAVYLAQMLLEGSLSVTIVERDRERCEQLCDLVPKAHVVCGDATRSDVLMEEGLGSCDAFVALTGEDGDNVVMSLYARRLKVPRIVAKVNREHFSDILEDSGLDSIVSPKELIAQQLARYVRAMNNSVGSSMETLYRMADGQVEVMEYRIEEASALVGVPLKDLKLRRNILIGAVIRGTRCFPPDGSTALQAGDHAVIVAMRGEVDSADSILEGRA